MNAAETIKAAIERLEYLRDEATGNGVKWEAEAGPNSGEAEIYAADSDSAHTFTTPAENATLIVTLHRTIDAQLAILHVARVERPANQKLGLDLARAILGEVS